MPKITITTNDGTIVEVLEDEDIGDLNKTMARNNLMCQIRQAIRVAKRKERDK